MAKLNRARVVSLLGNAVFFGFLAGLTPPLFGLRDISVIAIFLGGALMGWLDPRYGWRFAPAMLLPGVAMMLIIFWSELTKMDFLLSLGIGVVRAILFAVIAAWAGAGLRWTFGRWGVAKWQN
jgi:hypothetical protein